MRINRKRHTTLAAFVGAGIVAVGMLVASDVSTEAAEAQREGGPGGRMHRPSSGGPMRMLPPLRRLDLSETQREQIRTLVAQSREASGTTGDQIRAARQALHDAVTTAVVNEGEIRALAASLATLEGDAAVHHAYLYAQVWQLLTPDQQASAQQLEAEMAERREERRQRMEEHRAQP